MIRKLFYGVFLLCVISSYAQTNKRVKISNITQQQVLQLSNVGIDMHCGVYQDGNDLILELTPYEQDLILS